MTTALAMEVSFCWFVKLRIYSAFACKCIDERNAKAVLYHDIMIATHLIPTTTDEPFNAERLIKTSRSEPFKN
jgi:hypothetical protein